ncbi:MAG: glycoside hydrolase family 97 N-terminal domain-containing protein [Opitutae bacterium]|nr:glycoside hydrolase family 97 N-terminal domain-containing protein [Opitutae bacterium]
MKIWPKLVWFCTAFAIAAPGILSALEVKSPDGRVVVNFAVKDFAGAKDCAVYQVSCGDRIVVAESRLGLALEGGVLQGGLQLVSHAESQRDVEWRPVYGERSVVRDQYRQLAVELQETAGARRRVALTFRAYNEGAAFCYTLPKQDGAERVVITKELSEFRFAADHPTWAVYTAQGEYAPVALSQVKPGCERPLTVQLADDLYAALAEARLVDYARMKFAPLAGAPHCLVSQLSSSVSGALPLTTPWRVVMVAPSPGRLLENNDLLLNLNDPCAIADTSWIKPGKVLREVTLTTVGSKACVDFAVRRNLQYIMFDAGWYGPETSDASDARGVNLDPARSKGPLDLPEVLRYAAERGIGVILYVNRRALERQADELFPLYKKWGVKGVKFGFVNVGSQQWTTWLHDTVRKAAQHQLLVDIHDEYRPTGYSRTYPNLLTQEGVAGDETTPSPRLTLTIQFTRMLAGAADNTVCYYAQRVDQMASHAYQLAKAVCLYSPWQHLYWYDRPPGAPAKAGGAGGAESVIGDEPELKFYDRLPTVWDDTKVIHGHIGEYAVIARRRGVNWFVGAMNGNEARTLSLPLNFLEKGQRYDAYVHSDDPTATTRTRVKTERLLVSADTVLPLALPARGGQAIRIELAIEANATPAPAPTRNR